MMVLSSASLSPSTVKSYFRPPPKVLDNTAPGIVPGCTCNGRDAFGLVNPAVTDDPTLRAGDIVATKAGLMAYSGGANGPTFTPISTYAGLSADLRRQLTETKIEPAAEESPQPPPVRQAEASPARSTKNKRAQADQ